MNHQEIIIIVATITFFGTVGTAVWIRRIMLTTHEPVNRLVRAHQDIELGNLDYIEPTHPSRVYNQVDLIAYERLDTTDRVPSYWSEGLPSYHTQDRWYIHSYLENEINLDLIFWLILFLLILFVVIVSLIYFKKYYIPY